MSNSWLHSPAGGQPCDVGTLIDCAGRSVAVTSVANEGGLAVHSCAAALEPGAAVTVVVDWARRWDHTTQHSAQHLITARALRVGLPTLAWALGDEVSTLDLDLSTADGGSRPFGLPQLRELEAAVNADVRRGALVRVRSYSADSPELAEARTRGLPAGVTGQIRVVELEGESADAAPLDVNLCCGTHVQSLAHLQLVSLLSFSTMQVKKRAAVRLQFVAADRALRRLADDATRSAALTKLLSCQPAEHCARVEALKASLAAAERTTKRMLAELAEAAAREVAGQVASGSLAPHVARGPDPERAVEYAKAFAQAVGAHAEAASRVVLLTVCAGDDGEEGLFALIGPAKRVAALAPGVARALEGRGGGKGLFQGKGSRLRSGAAEALRLIAEAS